MIINLFRNNRPSVYVLLLFYTVLLRGLFLVHPQFETPPEGSFLSPYIIHWIQANRISDFSLQIADILLIFIEAIFLNFILTANNIFSRNSFIPALIFITLSSLFGEWIKASVQTVAQLFLLISLMNLFSITGKETGRENVFYTALFLGLGSLFYFPVSLFLLVIIFGIILRSLSFAELMLVLIGFVLPYYFIGLAIYYGGDIHAYLYFLEQNFFINPNPVVDTSLMKGLMLIYLLILVAFGYFQLQSDREFKIVKHRRLVLMVLGYFILSALTGPLIAGSKLLYIQLIVLPATIFVSKIFIVDHLRIWHHLLFFILFFGLIAFELDYLNIVHW